MSETGGSSSVRVPAQDAQIIGNTNDSYVFSSSQGWDLTRGTSVNMLPFSAGTRLETSGGAIYVDTEKVALLVIDMQNYSLSTSINGPPTASLRQAIEHIVRYAIPAARKLGIQVVWVNWGLTEEDLSAMPPSILRAFGWRISDVPASNPGHGPIEDPGTSQYRQQREVRRTVGIGDDLGSIADDSGTSVEGGRVLLRDTWNSAVGDALLSSYEADAKTARPDVLIHKNRNSGLWTDDTPLNLYLKQRGIRTLLFTGMNTDQCILSTFVDAQARGYDAVLLNDGCATDSPAYAQAAVELNCRKQFGFMSSCLTLAKAANLSMEASSEDGAHTSTSL